MGGGPAHGADVTAEVVRLRDATRVSKTKTHTLRAEPGLW